jgi:hypothetical protein
MRHPPVFENSFIVIDRNSAHISPCRWFPFQTRVEAHGSRRNGTKTRIKDGLKVYPLKSAGQSAMALPEARQWPRKFRA